MSSSVEKQSTSQEQLARVPAGHTHNSESQQTNPQESNSHPNQAELSPGSNNTNTSPNREGSGGKEGIYMRKLNLMKVGTEGQPQSELPQLRIQTDIHHLKSQALQTKWEELIISGRNIQNRSVFASVIHNNTLYIYGGYDITAGILSDFHKMNLSKQSYVWEQVAVKNPKRSPGKLCKSSVVVYREKMYILGGQYVGSMDTNRMFCFDFATDSWEEVIYSTTNGVQIPCIDSHRAVVYNDTMIVVSGYLGEVGRYSECVYQFHFPTKSWSILYNAATLNPRERVLRPRIGTDIALSKETIYLFGGYDGSERLNDLYAFDIRTKSWRAITPHPALIPKTRRGHSLSVFGDFLILFGGIHDVTWELDDLYVFDLKNNKWIEIDGDSARRKEYTNVGDISPTKPKNQQARMSYKRTSLQSGTLRSKSIVLASPLKSSSGLSPHGSPDEKRGMKSQVYINDPYYQMAELSEQQNSPTKNLENQKKKEFFQRKADMLAMLTYDEDESGNAAESSSQQANSNQRQNSNSPTSEAMKNALITIGNPMPELKVKKGKTTDFGRVTFSKFLEPIKSSAHSKVGKKPCARDGHVAIVHASKMYIFGGDRHKMSFNDLFLLNLDELKQ